MDVKLKQKLNTAVDAAIKRWKDGTLPKYKTTPAGVDHTPCGVDIESKALTRRLIIAVHWNLRNQALWGKVKDAIADDALAQIFSGTLRRLGPKPEPAQLPLPGFEHVPRSLGSGKYRLRLPEVPVVRFLKFESRYQARAERNKQTADELRRIAEMVRPYQESDPGMTVAEAMEKTQAAAVIVMTPRKKAQ